MGAIARGGSIPLRIMIASVSRKWQHSVALNGSIPCPILPLEPTRSRTHIRSGPRTSGRRPYVCRPKRPVSESNWLAGATHCCTARPHKAYRAGPLCPNGSVYQRSSFLNARRTRRIHARVVSIARPTLRTDKQFTVQTHVFPVTAFWNWMASTCARQMIVADL